MVKHVVKGPCSSDLRGRGSAKTPVFARGCGISEFSGWAGVLHAPKPGAIPNFAKPGYSVEDFAVVVKYVVKGILPHFQETFKSGDWGKLGRNRGVCNISGS